ncbi:hypothetical protein BLNAU_4273 [Blattamonas nauphoetae]|uniref:Uncharacterized protein n=1 Tax=Blattamonas nauphoetae TaxID=2049346 RepID=A0ABQ9YB33_9EUKA|nr:hypothetical protein BLNAU_4273 [Blattamonas nauphoetae]
MRPQDDIKSWWTDTPLELTDFTGEQLTNLSYLSDNPRDFYDTFVVPNRMEDFSSYAVQALNTTEDYAKQFTTTVFDTFRRKYSTPPSVPHSRVTPTSSHSTPRPSPNFQSSSPPLSFHSPPPSFSSQIYQSYMNPSKTLSNQPQTFNNQEIQKQYSSLLLQQIQDEITNFSEPSPSGINDMLSEMNTLVQGVSSSLSKNVNLLRSINADVRSYNVTQSIPSPAPANFPPPQAPMSQSYAQPPPRHRSPPTSPPPSSFPPKPQPKTPSSQLARPTRPAPERSQTRFQFTFMAHPRDPIAIVGMQTAVLLSKSRFTLLLSISPHASTTPTAPIFSIGWLLVAAGTDSVSVGIADVSHMAAYESALNESSYANQLPFVSFSNTGILTVKDKQTQITTPIQDGEIITIELNTLTHTLYFARKLKKLGEKTQIVVVAEVTNIPEQVRFILRFGKTGSAGTVTSCQSYPKSEFGSTSEAQSFSFT